MRPQPTGALVGIAIYLALAGAACSAGAGKAGSGPGNGAPNWPATPAAIAAYQAVDRQQMLEDGARQETQLVWYTPLIAEIQTRMVQEFEKKYPFIKVQVYRSDPTTLRTKANEELKAGKPSFDVMDSGWQDMQAMEDAKELTPWYSPQVKSYPERVQQKASGNLDYWAMEAFDCLGFAYNTNLLPAAAVPKTYQDLLNPALKGKMTISGASGITWTGNVITNQGQSFAQQLARQQAIQVQQISAKAVLDLVASGEVAASPTVYQPHVLQAQASGAPVKWVALEPATCVDYVPAVSNAAPHPHAAMLWIDFVLGPDGRKVVQDLSYDTAATDPGFKAWYPDLGMTLTDYEQKYNQWQQFLQTQFIGH